MVFGNSNRIICHEFSFCIGDITTRLTRVAYLFLDNMLNNINNQKSQETKK
jgi:hypothetical protein